MVLMVNIKYHKREKTHCQGGVSGIRGFNGVQRTLNIPQINLTGLLEISYQSELNTRV